METTAVVFVHGLFSSGKTWARFKQLISSDGDLAGITVLEFEYPTPIFNLNPLKRIPDYSVVAESLKTFLETEAAAFSKIVVVTHSQGGLVVQRFLAQMVMNSQGRDLQRLRRVVMFACPNSGSDIFLTMRRLARFWYQPQERDLRPINAAVTDTHRVLQSRVIHAQDVSVDRCPIDIVAYAGEQDNVVTPSSAKGAFPDTGVLPGDHFSIIQPNGPNHRSYLALKRNLLLVSKSIGHQSGTPSLVQPEVSRDDVNIISAEKNRTDLAERRIIDDNALDIERNDNPLLGRLRHPIIGTLDFYDRQTMIEIVREVGKLDEQ